jgi:hypothetical protein
MKRRGKSEEGRVKAEPPVFALMELLAMRLGEQTTLAKSLVILPSPFFLHREIL